ncbi:ABC transporter, substrate-binding protein (cluster 13, osmolytes) / ABC transporter, permease protein (cluster 13, osmolytes) [hydrothermal vent metagenome]|uniref:ABC transporter, substrate-binding protein (Cluster 13, osmolytes) / ABC transporter, permease protein (Cluster 13, osmolytes) n=1 Tax=hydrothermal vent metagenome TaxID=652676 RepID=A0A3B0ZL76_9ZZZZ
MKLIAWFFAIALVQPVTATEAPLQLRFGSKVFTESVILGEMLQQLAETTGVEVVHQQQLGGTRVLWNALLAGEIDAYPEYTGTLIQEILAGENLNTQQALEQALATHGLRVTATLGFNNTYAIGVTEALGEQLALRTISDLKKHPALALGFGNEFMDRADGWPGLQRRYQLPQRNVRGLDHDLAYRGIEFGTLQVIDLYSTDAEIAYYKLRMLEDDLAYFPVYDAVILYRADLAQRAPDVVTLFNRLAGHIDAATMSRMNAQVKLDGQSESAVAAGFLQQTLGLKVNARVATAWQRFWQHTTEHFILVGISLSAAILVAIPLGILAARRRRLGHAVLAVASIIQTIPSLALFVFMIPPLGIGAPPAIVALFLYSLLPIIRNTYAGLTDIPSATIESAQALGLPSCARLRIVELPLATRSILAGIKTSAVINVGTATLAALIGAGGYGQPILTGIRLDDTSLILQGAIPAAVLALLVQGVFELIERGLLPRGLTKN